MPKCKEKLCDFPSKVECKWKDFEKNFNNGNLSDFFGQPNWPPLSELNWNSRNPFKSYVGLKLICFLKIAEIRPNQNVDIEVLLILILWKNTTFTEYSVTSCHWPIITDLMILRAELRTAKVDPYFERKNHLLRCFAKPFAHNFQDWA